jgi:methylsterol monooxygenase
MNFLNYTTAAGLNHAEQLYQGTDFSSLNWLEKQWAAWYIWLGNPIIATGLMSFLLHEVSFAFFDASSRVPLKLCA